HDRRYAIDASKITRELGWRPRHDVASGLAATVRWYLDNRAWCGAVQAPLLSAASFSGGAPSIESSNSRVPGPSPI
ncbi:MAG TPA: hypothetical protein VLK83_11825, partial [Rhodanobacteraceae bacterium]|nr:hypothetical protein [Rhodanobacteraceae bacterium]